jgi:hypothetical protein
MERQTTMGMPVYVRNGNGISLGAFVRQVPVRQVKDILRQTGKSSIRERCLPAHIVVFYVIALALFMNSPYREVLRWLMEGHKLVRGLRIRAGKTPGRSAISQARIRLGVEPLRQLCQEVVKPIATRATKGAWYRGWRLVSLDGSTVDVADTPENEEAFGRSKGSRGDSAFPKLRFAALIENGTRVMFAMAHGGYGFTSEKELARKVIGSLTKHMLCLGDRYYLGYEFWQEATRTGAALLWRAKTSMLLTPEEPRFSDGSYLASLYRTAYDRERRRNGIAVRVVEYKLEGARGGDPYYRLVTNILDPEQAPAEELAALYHQRWEIENALDEVKTHLRGPGVVLRSRLPELVEQEWYGFMLAYFVVRGVIHEAALQAREDPDRLSFTHAVRVIRRKLPMFAIFPPATVA